MKKLTLITLIILTANLLFGQINKIDTSFYSEALQEEKMVDVYFPPGYDENPNLYYPVIYYLHAWGGDQNMMGEMLTWTQSLINDGTIEPVIMVGADNSPGPFEGSVYVNSILWGNYEDYMVNDLINWVDSSFRTIPERDGRALLGQSMGAFGAFRYGILHKDKFRVLAAHAGTVCLDDIYLETVRQQVISENQGSPPYFYDYTTGGPFTKFMFIACGAFAPDTNSPQTYINPQVVDYIFDENANFIDSVVAKIQANDIIQLIHQLSPSDNTGIYFGCATNDNWELYPGHLTLKDTLDLLGLPYEFYSHNGGHNMPGAFKKRALIFIDSLIMSPIIVGIKAVAKEKTDMNLRNYPNPFDHSTTIQFELFKSEYIELSIYNHLGQQVEILVKGIQEAGKLKTLFDASKLPSGIYFCQLRIGKKVVTKKIIKTQ